MSSVSDGSLPVDDDPADKAENDLPQKPSRRSDEEIRWKVVAKEAGLGPATIIAGRLHTEGIPARAWQEGAGKAIGLTVGLLGTGYVEVPEEYVDEAEKILSEPWDASEIDEFMLGEDE